MTPKLINILMILGVTQGVNKNDFFPKDAPFQGLSNEPGAIAWNGLRAEFEAKYTDDIV